MSSTNAVSGEIRDVASFLAALKQREYELQRKVDENSDMPEEDKHMVKFFYRGHAAISWDLLPSLFRPFTIRGLSGDQARAIKCSLNFRQNTYFPEEQYILQEAQRVFPKIFDGCINDVGRLAVLQHYGFPTRLLDVTGNVLVALYFATLNLEQANDEDANVYVIGASACDYQVASTAGLVDKITVMQYHERGTQVHVQNLYPILIFPPFHTKRQSAQDSAFLLFENTNNMVSQCKRGEYSEICIPKASKQAIHEELETSFNIHAGTLFPETIASYSAKLCHDAKSRVQANAALPDEFKSV